MLRILRVTNDLYPDVIGGVPLHVNHLCRDISRLGYPSTVVTCSSKHHHDVDTIEKCRVIYNKTLFSPLGNSFSPHVLPTLLRIRDKYDIVHAHCHLYFSTIVTCLVHQLGSPPLIITTHGTFSASAPDWFNMLFMKTFARWELQTAEKIICYTDYEKENYARFLHLDKEKIRVIPNGIDTDLFHPDTLSMRKHREQGETQLLWVGRLVQGKGIIVLLKAVKRLLKSVPGIRVVLVGDGPQRQGIVKLIHDLNLEKRVTIKTNVNYEDMPKIYQECDIFVLPSFNEGVPKTLLEAMACGKPAVISKFPHLVDLLQGSGIMVSKRDVEGLAKGIQTLIEDESLAKKMGARGREKILKGHSWETTVSQTVKLYEEIAG